MNKYVKTYHEEFMEELNIHTFYVTENCFDVSQIFIQSDNAFEIVINFRKILWKVPMNLMIFMWYFKSFNYITLKVEIRNIMKWLIKYR